MAISNDSFTSDLGNTLPSRLECAWSKLSPRTCMGQPPASASAVAARRPAALRRALSPLSHPSGPAAMAPEITVLSAVRREIRVLTDGKGALLKPFLDEAQRQSVQSNDAR